MHGIHHAVIIMVIQVKVVAIFGTGENAKQDAGEKGSAQ
jgi:hypothetical protein